MRVVCVYTEQHETSCRLVKRCVKTAKRFRVSVEPYQSVHWDEIDGMVEELGLRLKLEPHKNKDTTTTHCPAFRLANGLTHYRLYRECERQGEPIVILEHDAVIVGPLPDTYPDGVTQLSSHQNGQADSKWYRRGLGKFVAAGPEPDLSEAGIVPHPYTRIRGTSGYAITPSSAYRMVCHVQEGGVAYADRLHRDMVGDLWLVIPQPVETRGGVSGKSYYQ